VLLDRTHPRASSSGYVFEHIVVMERTILARYGDGTSWTTGP